MSTGTEIEFIGFADGCRVNGRVQLDEARLADLLNRQARILLRNAVVVRTADGLERKFDELEVDRDELDIVVADGPRGDPRLRRATACDCISVQVDGYSAEGFRHSPTGGETALDDPPAMMALTDAVLEYSLGAEPRSEWFRTLLVNRELATSVRTVACSEELAATIA